MMDAWRDRWSGEWARFAVRGFALLSVLGAKFFTCQPDELDCLRAERGTDTAAAVLICQQEYDRAKDPATGALLANVLRRGDQLTAASALATTLLTTSAQSDALAILGRIALQQRRFDAARSLLDNARAIHLVENRPKALAADDQMLAFIAIHEQRFGDALRKLDACISEARQAKDRSIESYCHMTAAHTLVTAGYFEGAKEALRLAKRLATTPHELANLAIVTAGLEQKYGPGSERHNRQAEIELRAAIEYANLARDTRLRRQAELNLVYSLAELGRTEEAAQHLDIARVLDANADLDSEELDERAALQARIAYRSGDLTLATSINTRTFDRLNAAGSSATIDDRVRICVMQAEIGLTLGLVEDAIRWATRGVDLAGGIRGAQKELELRPWIMSLRRRPHELLFTALARARRFEDALVVFDRWQGRTLHDALARGKSQQASPPTLSAAALHTEELLRLVPLLSNAPIMKPLEPQALLDGIRHVDLVALLVAEGRVWRITSRHGDLDIEDLGAHDDMRPALDQFITEPTRVGHANALGPQLLGQAAFQKTDETLYVLLDTDLAKLPVAALRSAGEPLVARRPIVRPPRLSELGCVPAVSASPRVIVIGDSRGNLPAARREAEAVARRFNASPHVGANANYNALLAATGADILHLAVHARVELGVGSLELADRSVSALEISTRNNGHGDGVQLG
jgi:hypothetical protein